MSYFPLILPVETTTSGIIRLMFQIMNELELRFINLNSNNVIHMMRLIIDYINAFHDIVNITFNNVVFNNENILANNEIYQIIVRSLITFNEMNTPICNFTIDTSKLYITRNKSKSVDYIDQVNKHFSEQIIFNVYEATKIESINNIKSIIKIIKKCIGKLTSDNSLVDVVDTSTNLLSNTVTLKNCIYEAVHNIYMYAQNYNIINKIIEVNIKNGYKWENTNSDKNNYLRNNIKYIFTLAYQIQNYINGLYYLINISTMQKIDLNNTNTNTIYDTLITIRRNVINWEVLLHSKVDSILYEEKQNDIYKINIISNNNPYYCEIIFNEKKHLSNLAYNRLCTIRENYDTIKTNNNNEYIYININNYCYNKLISKAELMHNHANNVLIKNKSAFDIIQELKTQRKRVIDKDQEKDKAKDKDKENVAYALLQLKNTNEEHVTKKRRVNNEL